MVQVNVTRLGAEILGETVAQAKVTKQGVEAGIAGSGAAAQVNVSRFGVEVLMKGPVRAKVTKVGVEAGVAGVGAAAQVNVSRLGFEVLISLRKKAKVTKQGVEAAIAALGAASQVNVSRLGAEILSRRGFGSVVPLALVAGLEHFLHNWADVVVMENAFSTDISTSASSGAEDRRGLHLKPQRILSLTWTSGSRATLERMAAMLRTLTESHLQIPLYQDQTDVETTALFNQPVLALDTTRARFFAGGRVAVVHLDAELRPSSVEYYEILERTSSSLKFTTNLSVDIEAGCVVFPLIDVDIVLEPNITWVTGRVASISLTVEEKIGASQLPPLQVDNPDGFPIYQNTTCFCYEPDWVDSVTQGYSRHGSKYTRGRAPVTYIASDRARGTQEFRLSGDRAMGWQVIRFFETRRGRLRSFFQMDQDDLLSFHAISGVFIDVDKLGVYSDFLVALDDGYVGVQLADGSVVIREVVTVQDLPSSWRITVADAFPAIALADVVRFARARKVRCVNDVLTERWTNTNHFSTTWSTIETLNEGEFTL